MVLASFVVPSSEKCCSMDYCDIPKACPLVEGRPLRYSVGFYRGKRRCVVAWFADLSAAADYCVRMTSRYPDFKIDLLESLF